MTDRTELAEAIRRAVRAVVPLRGVDAHMVYLVGAGEADPGRLVRGLGRPGSRCGLFLAVPTVAAPGAPLHGIT